MKDDSSAVASNDQITKRSRDVAWYNPELTSVPSAAREILEHYSKIPVDEIERHVFDIVRYSKSRKVYATRRL